MAVTAAPAHGQVKLVLPTVDLLTQASVQIDGATAGDQSGYDVDGDFDFNDDGTRDLLIGAPYADPLGRVNAGSAWVVFGFPAPLVDLSTLGAGGVRIDGAVASGAAGLSVSKAGDVNGDGVDDVIVGAPSETVLGQTYVGAAYVVFGTTSPAPVDLSLIGTPGGPPGFRITGAAANDFAGISVSDAGNVNGDEFDDVIVGAYSHDYLGRVDSGTAYVVFGKNNNLPVDLAALGAGGYPLYGATAGDNAGWSVANAGDVNLDGRPDQLVGAPNFDAGANLDAGAAYVAYGKVNTTPIDLAALGAAGYRIEGEAAGDGAGFSVDSAGDVNFDTRPEQLVGAPSANGGLEGAAYVVHGKTGSSTVQLATFTTGYEIEGVSPNDQTGAAVAGLGNATGGLGQDQIVGAHGAGNGGRTQAGSAYVVEGQNATTDIDLATYLTGFRIDGAASFDLAGLSVAGPGNVGGDGARDVLVGAVNGDANGRLQSGSSYLVFGTPTFTAVQFVGALNLSNRIFTIPGIKVARAAARGAAAGTSIRYTLGGPATVTMRMLRVLPGRRVGVRKLGLRPTLTARCAPGKPKRGRARERKCTRYVEVGRLVRRHARGGGQRVPFAGRIRRRALPPGRYRLELTARDRSGHVHGPLRATFRVAR
jgi:hypothetical protein